MSSKKEPKKSDSLKYSSLGFQMAITIGLFAWLGNYLDEKYNTEKPYYSIALILVGIAIALYQVIKEVITMTNNNDESNSKDKLDEK
jgi:F0F1-type ATP synthase assembly protein I